MQSNNQNPSKIYPKVYKIGQNMTNYGQTSTIFSYQSSNKNQYPIQTSYQPQYQSVKPQTQPQRTSRVSLSSGSTQRYNYITFDNPPAYKSLVQSQQYYPTQLESNIPQINPIKLLNSGSASRYNIGPSQQNYKASINLGHNSVSSSFTANNQNELMANQPTLSTDSNLRVNSGGNYLNTFKGLQKNYPAVNAPINSRLTLSYENKTTQTPILTKISPTITASNPSPQLKQSLESIQQISTLKSRINGLEQQNKKQKELRIQLQQKLAQMQKLKSSNSQKLSQQNQLIEKLQAKILTLQSHQLQLELTNQNRKYSVRPSIEAITNLENKILDLQNSYNIYQLIIEKQRSLITILDKQKTKKSLSKTNKNSSINMNDEENILRNQIKLLYKDIEGDQNGQYE